MQGCKGVQELVQDLLLRKCCRKIKSQRAEKSLPQFDLGRKVGRKIGLQKMRRAVVLVVVDAADFDGSLPRAALEGLFANIEGYQVRASIEYPDQVPQLNLGNSGAPDLASENEIGGGADGCERLALIAPCQERPWRVPLPAWRACQISIPQGCP